MLHYTDKAGLYLHINVTIIRKETKNLTKTKEQLDGGNEMKKGYN